MPSPFPGMDPYLEAEPLWHTVHTHLVVEICEHLQSQLVPRHVASCEEGEPVGRVETPQRYVTIRDARTHEIVTAIEIFSPWNKTGGYEDSRAKQREYLRSDTNLVEIDLLRAGRHRKHPAGGR